MLELELSENALGERAMQRLAPLLNGHTLQRIYFSNCGLSFASLEIMKDAIVGNDGKMANSLEELVLDKNMIGVNGARVVGDILKVCTNLQLLSYRGCRPLKEGTKHICQGLEELTGGDNSKLRHLDMEDCSFGSGEDDPIVPLCAAIARSPRLSYLDIPDGDLKVEGVQRVSDALETSGAKLTHLNLGTATTILDMLV